MISTYISINWKLACCWRQRREKVEGEDRKGNTKHLTLDKIKVNLSVGGLVEIYRMAQYRKILRAMVVYYKPYVS